MTRIIVHNHLPVRDNDGLAERIAGAKALYERPGTPGEKAAAEAALRRMGVDPASFTQSKTAPIFSRANYSTVRKKYEVVLQYVHGDRTLYTDPFVTEASDEITAERLAREHAKWTWRNHFGGRVPEFRAYSTKRV
jgi:hypothetical protein